MKMEKLKKWAKLLKKDQRGLTLVELLAVVVILGIVGLIAFIAIGNVIENSKKDAHIANAQQVISAAELHVASGGSIPTDGDVSKLDTLGDLISPWNKGDYKGNFKVGGTDENITVESTDSNCEFSAQTKAQIAEKGRELCDEEAG